MNAGSNSDGYKEQGVTYPSGKMQKKLIELVFQDAKLDPLDVTYVETHGTGTRVGDPEECDGVARFFCDESNRKEPLLVGGVKSNMGHGESAAGLCGVAKILIAMEAGMIPGNLHYQKPCPDIPALLDGRLKVVHKNTPWKAGLAVANAFGFGGSNGHVVLRRNMKEKVPPKAGHSTSKPRLVTVSGRTEEAVNTILDQVLSTLTTQVHPRKIRLNLSYPAGREGS